jgi:hypothetical protein
LIKLWIPSKIGEKQCQKREIKEKRLKEVDEKENLKG